MKKIFLFILGVFGLFAMTSCGSISQTEEEIKLDSFEKDKFYIYTTTYSYNKECKLLFYNDALIFYSPEQTEKFLKDFSEATEEQANFAMLVYSSSRTFSQYYENDLLYIHTKHLFDGKVDCEILYVSKDEGKTYELVSFSSQKDLPFDTFTFEKTF